MTAKQTISFTMSELMPLVQEQLENGEKVSLTVKGVSMQPFLMDGRDSIVMVAVSPPGRFLCNAPCVFGKQRRNA